MHQYNANYSDSRHSHRKKRNRAEFEVDEHGNYSKDFYQTPNPKRQKTAHYTQQQPHTQPIHRRIDVDENSENTKNRRFQSSSMKFQTNFKASVLMGRKRKRQQILQQNYESASLQSKLSQPDAQNWKFQFVPNQHTKEREFRYFNDDDSKYIHSDQLDDSDQSMSEYPQNTNSSNPNQANTQIHNETTYQNEEQREDESESEYNDESESEQPNVSESVSDIEQSIDSNISIKKEEADDIKMDNDENRDFNIRKRENAKKEEIIRQNAAKRIEELRNEKIKERKEGQIREELRERIHPQIIEKAHPVKNNPISLIKCFYPKTRINANANKKDILKAFKRALANFHPDRTMNKSMEEQIRAEEIFKLLSTEKDKFENEREHKTRFNSYHHQNNYRRRQHGWF